MAWLLFLAGAIGSDQRAEALVVLSAGRATVEMGAQARQPRVGVQAGKLQLDVLVQELEAPITTHLLAYRPEQPVHFPALVLVFAHRINSFSVVSDCASPYSASARRSLPRASWRVL